MKKFTILLLFVCAVGFSQSEQEINKAIKIVEDLYYYEIFMGYKLYYKLDIDYNHTTKRITLIKESFQKVREFNKYEFYVDDIDSKKCEVNVYHFEKDDKFGVNFIIKTKEESIKELKLKGDNDYPLANSNYTDRIALINSNNMPRGLTKKYLDNLILILGIKNKYDLKYKESVIKK